MTPEERKIAVHFFNSCGVSILTAQDQGKRIDALERELEETKRRLNSAVTRLRALGEDALQK